MKRRLLPVIAWIGATGLSIAVANAAVGSVRNQVSDVPNLSLATTTATASVATAPPTTMVPISTSMPSTTLDESAIGPTSSTSPATTVATTSATTAASPTTTAAASTTTATTTSPAPTTTATAVGEIQTYSVTGGTVSIEVFADRIVLLGAVPAPGWSVEEVEQSSDHIEIEFKSGELESKFKAELGSGGQLSIETE